MLKRYAIVAGEDVFYIMSMDTEHPVAAKWIAALESDLKFVKVNNYAQVRPGYLYKDGMLYAPEDTMFENPLPEVYSEIERNQYAGVVGNDVIGMLTIDKKEISAVGYEMVDAGMQSDPVIVSLSEHDNGVFVNVGWTFKDNKFFPPVGA